MTVADPYPETLAEIDDAALGFAPADPTVKALNRIATALEQIALNQLDRSQPVQNGPQRLAALPPVQVAAPTQTAGVCPIHNVPWKVVPAGVSKKTGKPYDAFAACSVSGCDQRPPR
jgi:hypothetical protein